MRISTMTSDYDRFCKTLEEKIDHIYKAGFRYIDINLCHASQDDPLLINRKWKDNAKRLREYAEGKGMRFVQSHAPAFCNPFADNIDDLIEKTIRCIHVCKELGIDNTVIHAGWKSGLSQQEFYQRTRSFCENFFPAMEECGVNVLVENSTHANLGERAHFYKGEEMREFLDWVNHPLLHACWDTGHGNVEGPQYENITAIGPHLYAIHVSDNKGAADEHNMPYGGTLNMDDLMCGLLDVGFKGYFDYELTVLRPSYYGEPQRYQFEREKRLVEPTIEMQDYLEAFLYHMAEEYLRAYDCFEE